MVGTQRRVFLIFSGSDRLEWEFREKFVKRYEERLKQYGDWYQTATIPEANHILTMPVWQQQMLELSTEWINCHF